MRTLTYGGAVSLDGFLAGVKGSIDWLHFSKDVQRVMKDYWRSVDTTLMGRKTYAISVAQGPAANDTPKSPERGTKPSTHTYVFSRTLKAIDDPRVELVSTDAIEFVRELKRRPGKGICLMGGGELAQSLLGAGLVDEIALNIHPILLGSGIPAFRDPGHRVQMTLKECRPIHGGCILAWYKISPTA